MGIITKEKLIESLGEVRSAAFKYAADMQFIINEVEKINDDTVDVIRCKDCRFRGSELECTQFDAYTSAAGDLFSPPDGFYCGYGKRKEE